MQHVFRELRNQLKGMHATLPNRDVLMLTLEALDQLEADFAVLCQEVAKVQYDRNREAYNTSSTFDRMVERRGIDVP